MGKTVLLDYLVKQAASRRDQVNRKTQLMTCHL